MNRKSSSDNTISFIIVVVFLVLIFFAIYCMYGKIELIDTNKLSEENKKLAKDEYDRIHILLKDKESQRLIIEKKKKIFTSIIMFILIFTYLGLNAIIYFLLKTEFKSLLLYGNLALGFITTGYCAITGKHKGYKELIESLYQLVYNKLYQLEFVKVTSEINTLVAEKEAIKNKYNFD